MWVRIPPRSQRCFLCGFVSAKNRKGEHFKCIRCGHEGHADHNAAQNHTLELPKTNFFADRLKEIGEFFYLENGIFLLNGTELTVPTTKKM